MVPISVIIPVYNAHATLVGCLDSVLSQTFADFELICVDDGSTDGSTETLADYASKDSRVRVVTQSNQGLAGARNSGYDVAQGEFVIFLDADDDFEPTYLARVYEQAVSDQADIVIVKFRYVREGDGLSVESPGSLRTDLLPEVVPFAPDEARGTLFRLTTPCVWNKFFRRSFLVDEGLRFETSLARAEDVPFTFAALMLARKISVVDEVMVNYRTGSAVSLQSTIDKDPLAICRALVLVRQVAIDRGVFERFERDLVNVSAEQCLFALGGMRSEEAAKQLFEALHNVYLDELGAVGRDSEYFYSPLLHERLVKVLGGSFEGYWFWESSRLSAELRGTADRLGVEYGKVRDLQEASVSARDALTEANGRAAAAEASRRESLKLLMTRARVLRSETLVLNGRLETKREQLAVARDARRDIVSSRAYRIVSGLMPSWLSRKRSTAKRGTE